jgi:DNA-binding transcriptional MerR regulator
MTVTGTAVTAATSGTAETSEKSETSSTPTTAGGRAGHTIGEVVALTGLSAYTLRWYERIGLMSPVDRSHNGQRRYSDDDLRWLEFVGKLRLTGMPVADMVRYAELQREGDHTRAARQALLVRHREDVRRRIAELQATLGVLDFKIEHYGGAA